MRTLLFSGVVASLALAASPATAGDEGFYLGAGAGQVNLEVDDVLGAGINFDEDDTGFKIFGGYKFLPWLGVEAAYLDGGNPSLKASDGILSGELAVDLQAFVAAATFTLPLGDKFELFVKPGIAYWKSSTSAFVSDGSIVYLDIKQDDDDSAFFVGAGAAFNFSENFGIRLEYEWFEVTPKWDEYEEEFVQELEASAGFLSASFVYSF